MENLEDNDEGKVSKSKYWCIWMFRFRIWNVPNFQFTLTGFISNPFSTNPFSNWDLFNNHRVSKLESQYGNLHSHVARVAQANDHISNKMDNMDKKMVKLVYAVFQIVLHYQIYTCFLGFNGRDSSINTSSKSSKTPWKQRKWNECNLGKLTITHILIYSDLGFHITGNNGEWNQSRFGSNAYKTVRFWNGKF